MERATYSMGYKFIDRKNQMQINGSKYTLPSERYISTERFVYNPEKPWYPEAI